MILDMQTERPMARQKYHRDPDLFIAAKSGGGGFLKVAGYCRSWTWIKRNMVCAACGVPLGSRKSKVRADGLIRNAVYFECDGPDHHVIKRESDLRWKIGRQARDEKLRAKGKIKDMLEIYTWLTAAPPDDEDINW